MRTPRTLFLLFAASVSTGANAASNDLFFSEYIEGSSYNKAYEIYNGTSSSIDLSTYSVELYRNGATSSTGTNVLQLSGTLPSGDVYVVCNPNSVQDILDVCDLPTGSSSSGTASFNGDDALVLKNSTNVIDAIGQVGHDPGSEWSGGGVGTANETLRRKPGITDGDSNETDAFDPSLEWDSFARDSFDNLGVYGGGTPSVVELTIPLIQGAGHTSPYEGERVSTNGIVTAVDSNGFYLQDADGDDDDSTSDAIFVFTGSAPSVNVGDDADVTGNVTEFTPGGTSTGNLSITELTGPVVSINSSGNLLPAPVVIGASGRTPPTGIIEDDNFASFDPATDGIDFYESLEAMYVSVEDAVAVSPINRFNEIWVVANNGSNATRINSRGGITIIDTDFNPERIQLQNDNTLTQTFLADVDTGDSLGNPAGVISYSFGNFEILMTSTGTYTDNGLAVESTILAADEDNLLVASYNVLNLDPNDNDGDTDVADGRFDRIAKHIVGNLNTPDIVALQEIQDSDGSEDSGVTDSAATAAMLIAAIQAAGGPAYEYIDIAPVNNTDGGQPGANIRVGYLYNPSRVMLDPLSVARIEDTDLSDGDAFEASRKPLAADFIFNDERIHLVNVHLASKGGSTPLFGTIQPIVNGKEAQREAQVLEVVSYVNGLYAADIDAKVVVLGDMNAFFFESPLAILERVGTNMNTLIDDREAYSYIFQGNAQALDHILVSNSLGPVSQYDIVHVNAEFADYASDHDPLVLQLNLPAPSTEITIEQIRQAFWQAVADGGLEGTGHRPRMKIRHLLQFALLLEKIGITLENDRKRWGCRLISTAIRMSDGNRHDWIEGDTVASISDSLILLRDQNCH